MWKCSVLYIILYVMGYMWPVMPSEGMKLCSKLTFKNDRSHKNAELRWLFFVVVKIAWQIATCF